MDQIKAEALNFFLCAATTISQFPSVTAAKGTTGTKCTHAQKKPAAPPARVF
jgi:hypothetical protein